MSFLLSLLVFPVLGIVVKKLHEYHAEVNTVSFETKLRKP